VTAPIRVLVVDDHAALRAALAGLLSATGEMSVVGEAVDGHDALELAAALRPDVVLMDVSMPNMSGLEATHVLTRQRHSVRVLMLSADGRCSVVRAARDGLGVSPRPIPGTSPDRFAPDPEVDRDAAAETPRVPTSGTHRSRPSGPLVSFRRRPPGR
jgi:CheY-like chemotaxis protein